MNQCESRYAGVRCSRPKGHEKGSEKSHYAKVKRYGSKFWTDEQADKLSSAEMLDEAHKAVAESIVGKPEAFMVEMDADMRKAARMAMDEMLENAPTVGDPVKDKTGQSREWWRYHFVNSAILSGLSGEDAVLRANNAIMELEKHSAPISTEPSPAERQQWKDEVPYT